MLRITAYDDNNKQIGHRILPVESLRPGKVYISWNCHLIMLGSLVHEGYLANRWSEGTCYLC